MITHSPVSFLQVLGFLILGIAVIVLLTSKFKMHAFFPLLIACFIVGIGIELPVSDILSTMKDGFGSIMKSLGLIIVIGTALGVILEFTGSTETMAMFILRKVGEKKASLAMAITGFIVGLPIFCDSGYIVLSGLNRSMINRSGLPAVVLSVSMAVGLYSVHCLIPPHPGATAAASTLNVDIGRLIWTGILVAIPAMFAGYFWTLFAGRKEKILYNAEEVPVRRQKLPTFFSSFLPVIIPIVLIALRSFLAIDPAQAGKWKVFFVLGDPVIALSIGVLLAFLTKKDWNNKDVNKLLQSAAEKAGGILVIIGAGGAFGAILASAKIGSYLTTEFAMGSMGILFPFLITCILKTAQGSSTVAIITAASIVQPLLPALILNDDKGKLLAVLSMGAGSMMISHANDAYFWVISRFSGIETKAMFRVYSMATIFMGLAAMAMIYILSIVL